MEILRIASGLAITLDLSAGYQLKNENPVPAKTFVKSGVSGLRGFQRR